MNTVNEENTQLRLFQIENPLKSKLGAEFFKQLPQVPGVYWMIDGRGRLLYIGKSRNLKKRLSSYRSLRPENQPARLVRLLLGTETIYFKPTDSESNATAVEAALLKMLKPPCNRAGVGPDRVFDWTIQDRNESWSLQIEMHETTDRLAGFKSPPRIFKVHGALLRQLHGLTSGRFSVMELPTRLLKGPAGATGAYTDTSLREIVDMYLAGVDTWPERPCPALKNEIADRWSAELWEKDQTELREAFDKFIRPFRFRQYGLEPEKRPEKPEDA